ncbi:hypothetical protein XBFM1_2040056 [Xenorhabdus bovienii str. feltiae Moldova]|uniref:Uncharacterized protein n=2 Tax=Xenorhabdus bovienii TaxID=40576 RepID=A0A0B6X2J1_XENBV|nr:hypothetical protein XBFM1_2040056 [Xenorhabdus bovienii str. feltiae Moldova]CDM87705.1 protein of unknown function [Xenorhabdus bovienii]
MFDLLTNYIFMYKSKSTPKNEEVHLNYYVYQFTQRLYQGKRTNECRSRF